MRNGVICSKTLCEDERRCTTHTQIRAQPGTFVMSLMFPVSLYQGLLHVSLPVFEICVSLLKIFLLCFVLSVTTSALSATNEHVC